MTIISTKEFKRASQRDLFAASTAVAGVAPGTALSTTPPFALWNPTGSKVALVLLDARCGFVSGTLGAGTLVYASHAQAAAPTGGTELTVRPTSLGNANTPVARAFQGSTLSGTPVILRPCLVLAGSAPFVPVPKDYVEGDIVVAPGQALVLQAVAAAGTSPLVLLAATWVEVNL
jgi:hypothetical protein